MIYKLELENILLKELFQVAKEYVSLASKEPLNYKDPGLLLLWSKLNLAVGRLEGFEEMKLHITKEV